MQVHKTSLDNQSGFSVLLKDTVDLTRLRQPATHTVSKQKHIQVWLTHCWGQLDSNERLNFLH